MPELPEVETIRLGLAPVVTGRHFTHVEARRETLRIPLPKDFAARLAGRQVQRVGRRGKYLLMDLDNGETLVVHMGMSGRFTVYRRDLGLIPACDGKHDHIILDTDDRKRIVFTDHRRFGLMSLVPTAEAETHPLFAGLGPEPLADTFTPQVLSAALKGKRTPIKSALLDQRVVAGLGNIYVCEALHRARISPKRPAKSVSSTRTAELVSAIKAVLHAAIRAGGSSLRDYAQANGELGNFQHHFAVYDREGGRCLRRNCTGTVRRIVQAGRSTFYCPKCQR